MLHPALGRIFSFAKLPLVTKIVPQIVPRQRLTGWTKIFDAALVYLFRVIGYRPRKVQVGHAARDYSYKRSENNNKNT